MQTAHLLLPAEYLALQAYPRLLLGLSGGLDSVVLLHALAADPLIKSKIQLLHVHHGVSPNADAWANHCAQMAARFNLPFTLEHLNLPLGPNLEERAREARYACFARHLGEGAVLLTAHHQHDQAETVLANLCRGAGVAGLAAMAKTQPFAGGWHHRPLLDIAKKTLQEYAEQHGLIYVEDESNANTQFTRNFLRQDIFPVMLARFPGMMANVTRTAEICSEAELILAEDAQRVLASCMLSSEKLSIRQILTHSPARRRNALHHWLLRFAPKAASRDFVLRIENELMLAKPDANPVLHHDGLYLRRYQGILYALGAPEQPVDDAQVWKNFPEPMLFGPHRLEIVPKQARPTFSGLLIRLQQRQGGERIVCYGQHKSVKKLLQAATIPPWERTTWPLVYINDTLAAIPGVVMGDAWRQYCSATSNIEISPSLA